MAPPPRRRARPPLHRAAGREPRAARLPRAAARRPRHGRAARPGVRAPRARRTAPRFFGRRDAAIRGRAAEAFDLAGVARDHAIDALAAALAMPARHRAAPACASPPTAPGAARRTACAIARARSSRVLEEVAAAGAEQVILVSAAPPPGRPHELSSGAGDVRGRAARAARSRSRPPIVRDALERDRRRFAGLYVVRPAHNPLGPFDFAGVYDERSDRRYSARRAGRSRLRGRLPPVHRAGRRPPAASASKQSNR